ncbi:MAG: GAF domain-containing protein, partial [Polyangiaceae bacterium]
MSESGAAGRTEVSRRQEGMRLLSESLHEFAETTAEYPRLLAAVARRVTQTIGDACIVLLLANDKKSLETAIYDGRDPEVARAYASLTQVPFSNTTPTLTQAAIQSGKPICIPTIDLEEIRKRTTLEGYELCRRIGARGILIVPLRVRHESIGAISIVRYQPDRDPLDELDIEIASDLASHAAIAISNGRLFAQAQAESDRRVKAEAALHESERLRRAELDVLRANRFLDAIIENIPDMVFVKEATNLS